MVIDGPTDLSKPAATRHALGGHLVPAAILAVAVLAIFADVLVDPDPLVVGEIWSDIFKQFSFWRQFGFDELARGNLALWNPHIFSGCPYFGGMQSALLYPPNWLFMVLPAATALNLSLALHLYLTGLFMYAWARHRGLTAPSATLAGLMLMLSGATFMQILPGHLPHLCTMAWAPLVLLAVEGLIDRPSAGWLLLGALAAAMQVLAGHPQYFFYTGVAALLFAVLNLITAKRRLASIGAVIAMFAVAGALAGVQLLTTFSEAPETLRTSSAGMEYAATYSFPPENFVCFIAPAFFGGVGQTPYWGRWFVWEVQPFIGVAGLLLAVYGTLTGPGDKRRFSLAIIAVMLVLALGAYTPLFKLTYGYVPGFDRFRNSCRFLFPATMFLAMLAGLGLDSLIRQGTFCLPMAAAAAITAVVLALMGWSIQVWSTATERGEVWGDILRAVRDTGESYFPVAEFTDKAFIRRSGTLAAESLIIAAGAAAVSSLIFILSRLARRAGYLAIVLIVAELFVFARFTQRPTFDLDQVASRGFWQYVAPTGDGTRTLNPILPDMAMSVGGYDLWGYDSFVLRRYIEFMCHTQGIPLDRAWRFQHIGGFLPHRLFAMLRCRNLLAVQGRGISSFPIGQPMGQLHLLGDYEVFSEPEAILHVMDLPEFDPRRIVILEEEPAIRPSGGPVAGWAKVVASSTDSMTIQAEVQSPAILLVTDAYSKHWHAKALPDSGQRSYTVMPANYTLRAIPLSAGRHHLRLVYSPWGFQIGKWVSLAALVGYLAGVTGYVVHVRNLRKKPAEPPRPKVTYVNPRVVHRD